MTAARRAVQPQMILPAAEASSGEIDDPSPLGAVRVPLRFGLNDFEPRLLAYWHRSEPCPTGRHLWDAIIVASSDGVPFVADDDIERRRFRLKLTCVRCGVVDDLRGIAEDDGANRSTRINPVPLRAGRILAQQVSGNSRDGVRDLSSWTVHKHPDTAPIGFIAWGCGPRGGRYFAGRLNAWAPGASVRGSTAEACLAKLARVLDGKAAVPTPRDAAASRPR